MADTDTI